MKDEARQTRSYLMDLFQQRGANPRTDLGQNFLIDLNLVDFIVRMARLTRDDVVLEVGAGTGGMTTHLAQAAGSVVSVELDRTVFPLAEKAVAPFDNVTLLNCDALKNKNHFAPAVLEAVQARLDEAPERRLKLVANLPYSIATPVVSNLMATELPWAKMVITVQWELAIRMAANEGTSQYGALSAWLQSQASVEILRRLGPQVFWPRPKVDSAIVEIRPAPKRRTRIDDRKFFQDCLRRLFHHRRKLLRRVLVGMYSKQLEKSEIDEVLEAMKFDPQTRAERLPVATLVDLSNRLQKCIAAKSSVETAADDGGFRDGTTTDSPSDDDAGIDNVGNESESDDAAAETAGADAVVKPKAPASDETGADQAGR